MMTGFGMGFGGLWMILVWLLIIGGGVWLLAALFPRHQANKLESEKQSDESALAILRQRYARGEITRKEFETIRRDLE